MNEIKSLAEHLNKTFQEKNAELEQSALHLSAHEAGELEICKQKIEDFEKFYESTKKTLPGASQNLAKWNSCAAEIEARIKKIRP